MTYSGKLTSFEKLSEAHYKLLTDLPAELHIHIIAEDIIRFRYVKESYDFSYAIASDFKDYEAVTSTSENEDFITIKTDLLHCQISKQNFSITIRDHENQVLSEELIPYQIKGNGIKCAKKIHADEQFFGLGDKAGKLNLKRKRLTHWNTDAYHYQRGDDPLYRTIPFFQGLREGKAYGIFLDNTYRTSFDFGATSPDKLEMSAEGGELNYYFIFGPSLMKVTQRYTLLTGTPELPPLWALGYQQCRWSYFPEAKVREIASQFRERKIPCDAIYLDIDYMNQYRCFTWNHDRFPDPQKMVAELKKQGFKTVTIIDPGIKVDKDYWVYQEGKVKGLFCKKENGDLYKGKVWPGPCHFPDFTHPESRQWWASLFKDLSGNVAVAGIWNDMNEPAVFNTVKKTFPGHVRHHYEGYGADHKKAHNIYGMQMARASYEGQKQWRPQNRPFTISRAGYSGLQRYALVWTGDNTATWDHLALANEQCQRLSVSGISFAGSDVGGFTGTPDPELYVRWIQLATFHTFFRTHSMGNHHSGSAEVDEETNELMKNVQDQEPWSFGEENTIIIKRYIELRYRLFPYFYTTFWQHQTTGNPVLRPLSMLDQRESYFHFHDEDFGFGDNLIICPILSQKQDEKKIMLPRGNWYYYNTSRLFQGNQHFTISVGLENMPIFAKAGSAIPHYPLMQYVGEKEVDQLQLHMYYAEGKHESQLYEDDGDGYQYKEGVYLQSTFTLQGSSQEVSLECSKQGSYTPAYQTVSLRLYGLPFTVKSAEAMNGTVKILQKNNDWTEIEVQANFKKIILRPS